MGLINLKTNLRNLKFGKDRPNGGSSNEPYIKTDIPSQDQDSPNSFIQNNKLFRSGEDVSRLTQYFFDIKSPKGLLFTAKQNLLSRIGVKTESSTSLINGGIYTPSSTLAQVAVNAFGGHLNKQGLDPTGLLGSFDKDGYEFNVKKNNEGSSKKNRLVKLYNTNQKNVTNLDALRGTSLNPELNLPLPNLDSLISSFLPGSILSYPGGPNSQLGIGKTNIRFADQRTGKHNINLKNLQFYQVDKRDDYSVFKRPTPELNKESIFLIGGENDSVSNLYKKLTGIDPNGDLINTRIGSQGFYNFSTSVYTPFTAGTFPKMSGRENDNNTKTFTQQDLIDSTPSNITSETGDSFVNKIISDNNIESSTIMSISPSYKTKNIGDRVNMGHPGKKRNVIDYGIKAENLEALDKLNALPIYEAESVKLNANAPTNDLVKFRIATLNNENNNKVYTHFRALINSFSDGYEGKINSTKYVGRGEEFYNYEGFARTISLTFTVYAQSKAELIPMFSKLNYLASTLAPDYTKAGFMRGNISQLTLGGYLYEQPGFIKSLTYDIPPESTWEIGIDSNGDYDSSVKELPLMINVSMNFQPIHTFTPRKDTNYKSNPSSKFISLKAAGKSNYSDLDSYSEYNKS